MERVKRLSIHFNPRTHEGCDNDGEIIRSLKIDFNPRTHEGCDRCTILLRVTKASFQSPHPRRVRLEIVRPVMLEHLDFNPRTHEGCDDDIGAENDTTWTFQSPHPRRVRLGVLDTEPGNRRISIPAPTKGATFSFRYRHKCNDYFNPRTHEGCDLTFPTSLTSLYIFQSPHPRRVRRFKG